jgi:stage V sporulation protein T
MKATGIVRRIDDLGRVVIPKEIRRSMRIKEGDPLEIFTTREGEVVFKKYNYADEHDWAKAKAIVKALHPDLQFALYDGWGDKQTATNVKFPQSIEFEDFDDREIKNSECDTIGYIEVDSDILTEDLEKIIKVLKEFFSEF